MTQLTLQDTPSLPNRPIAALSLVMVEPDIAPNLGTIIRMGACLGITVEVVEPCGFPFSPKVIRRSAMDYAERADMRHHPSWQSFRHGTTSRLVLVTPDAATRYCDFSFLPGDALIFGSEGTGLPAHARADVALSVAIPMRPGLRSLNVAIAAAMVTSEALRQIESNHSMSESQR